MLTLVSVCISASAQGTLSVAMSGGVAFTAIDYEWSTHNQEMYKDGLATPVCILSLSWLEHPSWSLSTGIGFMAAGGSDQSTVTDLFGNDLDKVTVRMQYDYLILNTLFVYRLLKEGITPRLLAGPRAGLLTGATCRTDDLEDFGFGADAGLGFEAPLSESLRFTLDGLYRWHGSSIMDTDAAKISVRRHIALQFGIACRI